MAEDRFEGLLVSYLLGELTVEEERELEHHLEGCSGCRDELARARQTGIPLGTIKSRTTAAMKTLHRIMTHPLDGEKQHE